MHDLWDREASIPIGSIMCIYPHNQELIESILVTLILSGLWLGVDPRMDIQKDMYLKEIDYAQNFGKHFRLGM